MITTKTIKTIFVDTNLSIISARAEIRKLARSAGLNTADQARISLATSTLAHFLDLGGQHNGEIHFECLNHGQKPGVRVICVTQGRQGPTELRSETSGTLSKLRWMVDELDIQYLPENEVQITMIKWAV